jgi:hypothetical protein
MPLNKRNHFIPRVLLRRFCTDAGGKKLKIWMFGPDADPIQTSINNVAVESFFYGKDGSLEELLSRDESDYNHLFEFVCNASKRDEHQGEISRMVWALAIRTRALRKQFTELTDRLLDQLVSEDNKDMLQSRLRQQLESEYDSIFKDALEQLPPQIRQELGKNPHALHRLKEAVYIHVGQVVFSPALNKLIPQVRITDQVKSASETGQIRGLTKLLNREPPSTFNSVKWEVIESSKQNVILGDCAVLVVGPDGNLAPVLLHNTAWQQIFLPMSPQSILVGTRTEPKHEITIGQLNLASVECSVDCYFSSHKSNYELSLIPYIGKRSSLFSDDELRKFIEQGAVSSD